MKTTHAHYVGLLSWVSVMCFMVPANAQLLPLWDDFSDGDAQDGMPATWIAGSFSPSTTISATTGDLSLSGVTVVESFPVIGDTSIRTQVTLPVDVGNDQVFVGVQARRNDSDNNAYSAAISTQTSDAMIVRETGSVLLAAQPIDVDITQKDVILQFDAIGDTLSLWVWRPGETMPASPQVTAVDGTHPDGVISLFSARFDGPDPEAIFRYVHVDTKHIPEPSTALLTLVGLTCLLGWQRRKCETPGN